MSRPRTVCVVPGFCEGKWHTRRLTPALAAAGYRVTTDIASADIILTHSAGCFFLGEASPAQTWIAVGPPYWPGKSHILGMLQKIPTDFFACLRRGKLAYWLTKTFWNSVYLLKDVPRAISIAREAQKHNLADLLRGRSAVIIRHHHDYFCTPDAKQRLAAQSDLKFYNVPGQHDDLWLDPTPIIKIMNEVGSSVS